MPSTSVSEVTSSNQSPRDLAIVHSFRIADDSDLDFSSLREPETNRTGDELSSFVVSASASEDLSVSLQLSRSAPTQSSSAASGKPSPGCAAVQPTRSASDLNPVIPDSLEQVFLTPAGQTSTQGANSFSVKTNLGQKLESSSPELEFRTQVSLILDSQFTQASPDLVGKYIHHWVQCLIPSIGNSNQSLRRELAKWADHSRKKQIGISDLIRKHRAGRRSFGRLVKGEGLPTGN